MSDVLIIARESSAASWLHEALLRKGYSVATADDLVSALPELYLSPKAMRVYVGERAGDAGTATDDALQLAAADPGPLGRHTYSPLDPEAADIIGFES